MRAATNPGDRGSAPIVGVILIVAVTIIIGAVMATFLLDIGENVEESGPVTTFEYTYSDKNNRVKVVMKSGDSLDGNLLRFGGAATEKKVLGGIPEWSGETVSAGDTATVEVNSDETLQIIWQGNRSEQTAILSTYEVPKDPSATASIGSVETKGTARTSAGGKVCVYNVQFSNTWGDSVYVVADHLDSTTEDSAILTTSGEDVRLNLNQNNIANGDTIEVVVYETKNENTQLDSVTSQATSHAHTCSV